MLKCTYCVVTRQVGLNGSTVQRPSRLAGRLDGSPHELDLPTHVDLRQIVDASETEPEEIVPRRAGQVQRPGHL